MTDYEILKETLNKGWYKFINPIECATDETEKDEWRQDWETDFLLLCNSPTLLFVFDENGAFLFIRKSF